MLFVQPVLARRGWWVSWSDRNWPFKSPRQRKQTFPGISTLHFLLCKNRESPLKPFPAQKVKVFPPKISIPVSVCGRVPLNTPRFHYPRSGGRDAESAQSALGFPRRGTSGLWETGVAASHISVLFVSLTQLSGRRSVCMWRHTPYHPSGRLLTPGSQTQGTGHSSNRVTHWFVLFTFTWTGDILLVNSK